MNALAAKQSESLERLFDSFFDNRMIMGSHPRDYLITPPSYPPYNIIADGNDRILEIALAGFTKDDISVEFESGQIKVSAFKPTNNDNKDDYDNRELIRRGIATRAFTRSWTVGSEFEVKDPVFKDGILKIHFESIKEAPKQLTIKSK